MWDPSKDRKVRRQRASERSEAFDRYQVDDSSWRAATAAEVEREVIRADYAHEDLGEPETDEDVRPCAICGEPTDGRGGGTAEMHSPDGIKRPGVPVEGIVHAQCGRDRGWDVS